MVDVWNEAQEVVKFAFKPTFFFFSIWVYFYEHSRITGLQGKGEDISLTLHRHLGISWAITAERLPLDIASSPTRSRNLWFPSASQNKLLAVVFLQ